MIFYHVIGALQNFYRIWFHIGCMIWTLLNVFWRQTFFAAVSFIDRLSIGWRYCTMRSLRPCKLGIVCAVRRTGGNSMACWWCCIVAMASAYRRLWRRVDFKLSASSIHASCSSSSKMNAVCGALLWAAYPVTFTETLEASQPLSAEICVWTPDRPPHTALPCSSVSIYIIPRVLITSFQLAKKKVWTLTLGLGSWTVWLWLYRICLWYWASVARHILGD